MALGLPDDPAQQKRLLIGVLPLLLLFAYWYFLHGDYRQEVTSMQTRLERVESMNVTARARSAQGRELEERLQQFEQHIDRLEDLVPRSEEVSQLLNQVHQRAEQVGVEVAAFRPGSTTTGEHYNRRAFELTVLGSYHNIGRLLADIGSLPRIITPVNFEVTPLNEVDRSGAQRLEAAFDLETYVLPEPVTRTAANTQGGNGA